MVSEPQTPSWENEDWENEKSKKEKSKMKNSQKKTGFQKELVIKRPKGEVVCSYIVAKDSVLVNPLDPYLEFAFVPERGNV